MSGEDSQPDWLDREAYPFDSHRVPVEGGGSLHYVDEGPGESARGTLVFVHGTPTWSFEWRHLIRAFRPTYRCLALDHLGFGLSARPEGADYSPAAHARRFHAWLDAVEPGDLTLVVHDFGGPIALPVALSGDRRVKRVVVFNSWMWSLRGDRDMERKARLAGGTLGRLTYRRLNASLRMIMPSAYGDRSKLTDAVHAQYLAPFPDADSREAVLWALARALLDSSDFYETLWAKRRALTTMPVLLVWGVRDSAFPRRFLAQWRVVVPHARVAELPVGHWPHEEAPDDVAGALRAFLGGP